MKKAISKLAMNKTSQSPLLIVRRETADQSKKTILVYLFFALLHLSLFHNNNLSAQNYWIQSVGGGSQDEVNDICSDNSGNIYSTGYFSANANFVNLNVNSSTPNIADIFVSKTNPNGVIQWVVKFGGSLDDRGEAIAVDNNGNIFVTGTFTGTANFGTINLTADSLSKDVFIAKINNSGNVIWAKRIGGPRGDVVNDICTDGNGNAIITGQFKASASFGSNIITSSMDTSGVNYTYDIFITKYDAIGNLLWNKKGGAKFDDRGMSITSDSNNNLFVACQFSDTINFGNSQINNQVRNATIILKLDVNGNILTSKKFSASSVIPNSIEIDDSNNVVVVGDFTGNMIFWGMPNYYLTNPNPRKIFIAKFSNNLNYKWSIADGSKKMVTAKSASIANDGSIFIYGQFGCTFTDYSNNYGDASFNSLGFSDLFLSKVSLSGNRIWQRSMGGPREDRAGGLTILPNNSLIYAGSFEDKLIIPVSTSCNIFNHAQDLNLFVSGANNGVSFCNDTNYGTFKFVNANALNDGFISNAIDLTRAPIDYYERVSASSSCLIPKLNQCIGSYVYTNQQYPANSPLFPWAHDCLNDTVVSCHPNYYTINTKTGIPGYVSPYYNWSWNGANFNNPVIYVSASTQMVLEMKTIDNCYTSYDTVQFIINPTPLPPLLSDNHNVNNQSPPAAIDIALCATNANLIVTASGIGNNILTWSSSAPIINQTPNSLEINQAGQVMATCTNSFGCSSSNEIELILDSVPPAFIPITNLPDTITICSGDYVEMNLSDSITNPNFGITCDYKFFASFNATPTIQVQLNNNCASGQSLKLFPSQSGWHNLNILCSKSNACGTTTHNLTTSVYVNLLPAFNILPTSVYDTIFFCPGNTINLSLANNMTGNWNGPSINNLNVNSISTIAVGSYVASKITMNNPLAVCIDTINLAPYHAPSISLSPINGIICPYDSVMLTSNLIGLSYQWFGPTGLMPQYTGVSAYGSIAGKYYCKVLTFDSCIVVSLNSEIKQYNSPYLISNPTSTICSGQTTTIEVKANDEATIIWYSPLAGNSPFQTISQPGIYSCSSTLCNITTNLSITISSNQDSVSITGPDTLKICPGQIVTISATSGMTDYNWTSGDVGQTISTSIAGSYQIVAISPSGCEVESNTILVIEKPSVPNPTVFGDTVCVGANAYLIANSSNPIQWYNQEFGGLAISNNDSIIVNALMNDTIFYAQATDTVLCNSERVFGIASVFQTSNYPVIYGDTIICNNKPINIYTDSLANAIYLWSGPNNFVDSSFSFTTANNGNYTLTVSLDNCNSLTSIIHISGVTTSAPAVLADTILCEGDSVKLIGLANGFASTYHWISSNISSLDSIFIIPSAMVSDSGMYFFFFNANGCNSDTAKINVVVKPLPIIHLDSLFKFCKNNSDSVFVTNPNQYNLFWNLPNGDTTSASIINFISIDSSIVGEYTVLAENNGCYSDTLHTEVLVNSVTNPTLSIPQSVCEGDTLSLYHTNPDGSLLYFNFNNQISFVTTSDTLLFGIDSSYTGNIKVFAKQGFCYSDTLTYNLVVNPIPMSANISGTTNICGLDSIKLFADSLLNVNYYWTGPNGFEANTQNISLLSNNNMNQYSGYYDVATINQFGCKGARTGISVSVHELPMISLGNDTSVCNNLPFFLEPNNSFVSYNWSTGNNLSTQSVDTTATLSLTVTDANGCLAYDTIIVTVLNCDLTLQNVFSPDGDGVNDNFVLASNGFLNYNINVYDRWGQVVFNSLSGVNYWDGKNKLGNYVDAGTYYFTVEAVDIANQKGFWKSYVNVIK